MVTIPFHPSTHPSARVSRLSEMMYISFCRIGQSPGREAKMRTAKEEVRKMLEQLPDDVSFEDIRYHIYVREKIERGLKDVQEGRVLLNKSKLIEDLVVTDPISFIREVYS